MYHCRSDVANTAEGHPLHAISKKVVHDLKEEKMKRQKAETALHQQAALVKELQKVVTALETKENMQLSVRQGLTIARLDADTKNALRKTAHALGKQSFGFDDADQPPSSATAARRRREIEAKTTTPHGRRPSSADTRLSASSMSDEAKTTLSSNSKIGDTRIEIASNHGFKRGMKVMIGSGTKAEIKTVVGLGSLILDSPLLFEHDMGEKVHGLAPTRKNLHLLEKRMMHEFIVGILVDEIIPESVKKGETHRVQLLLNNDYAKRPVDTHSIIFEPTSHLQLSNDESAVSSIASSSSANGMLMFAKKGLAYAIDTHLSPVNIINIFLDMCDADDVPVLEQSMSLESFALGVEVESALSSIFSRIAALHNMTGPNELYEHYADSNGYLDWPRYYQMLQVDHMLGGSVKSAHTRPNAVENGYVDSDTLEILFRVFTLSDFDNDELLTYGEVVSTFGDLDGLSPTMSDLSACCQFDVDTSSPIPSVDFQSFVAIRIKYTGMVKVLPAGLLLDGRRQIRAAIRLSFTQDSSFVSPRNVRAALHTSILSCMQLHSGKTVDVVLDLMNSSLSASDMEATLCGASLTGSTAYLSPRIRYLAGKASTQEVAQVTFDSTGQRAFVICKSGVAYVYDVLSCRKIVEQRVIWAEPMISRTVEGREKFFRWQKDSSITYVNELASNEKAAHVERVSTNLAHYALSFPHLGNLISVNGRGGLVALNCSVWSGAICFLDELSLRRVYRIKAPGALSGVVESSVRGILLDGKEGKPPLHRDCAGAVCAISLCAERAVLFCQIYGSSVLHCVSVLSGEVLSVLYGHHGPIKTYSLHIDSDFLLTGSSDCSARFWLLDNIFPEGSAFHRHLSADEKRVIGSTHSSKSSLRLLAAELCSVLHVKPTWRSAVVTGFCNGDVMSADPFPSHHTFEVEVMFDDATVKSYANRSLLRSPAEAVCNSAPLWDQPEPRLFVGQYVTVYEVDPEVTALCCARHLGVPCCDVKLFSEWARIIQGYINNDTENSEMRPVDVANALLLSGVDLDRKGSLLTLYKIIFDSSHLVSQPSVQEGQRRTCDRLLYGGHMFPIVSTSHSTVSKVIVTLDERGWCCVWDTVSARVSLSLIAPYTSPAIVGDHPFALVAKAMILDNSILQSTHMSVASMTRLDCPADMVPPFPLSPVSLADAYKLDCKFRSGDITARGLVYVMNDLSHIAVECSVFIPAMVAMNCPDMFMHNSTLLSNACVKRKGLSKLQKIYQLRSRILRVVYAVSCAHENLDQLIEDLSSYGVLQRGYNKTPSERVEVVCFEKVLLKEIAAKRNGPKFMQSVNRRQGSGIVTNILERNHVAVAVDGSNDILVIKASDVLTIFDRHAAFNDFHTDRHDTSPSRITLGCKVKFLFPPCDCVVDPSRRINTADVFLIHVNVTNDRGSTSSYALTWSVGRASYPAPATDARRMIQSDSVGRQLRLSYVRRQESLFGAMASYLSEYRGRLGAWRAVHAQMGVRLLQAASFENKENRALHGELSGEQALSIAGALSSLHHCLFTKSLDLLVRMYCSEFGDRAHPLLAHFADCLGSRSDEILAVFSTGTVAAAHMSTLDQIATLWLSRQGIRIEELYSSFCFSVPDKTLGMKTIDNLNSEFEMVTVHSAQGNISDGADSVGPIIREDLARSSLLSDRIVFDDGVEVGETDLVDADYKLNIQCLRDQTSSIHFLLRDHYLAQHLDMLYAKLATSAAAVKAGIRQSLIQVYQSIFHVLNGDAGLPSVSSLKPTSRRPVVPVTDHLNPSGTYSVLNDKPVEFFFPYRIVFAAHEHGAADNDVNSCDFFVWDGMHQTRSHCLGETVMRSLFSNYRRRIERLQTSVGGVVKPVVSCANDISFAPPISQLTDEELTVLQWSGNWLTMDKFCSNMGKFGLLCTGRLDLLRDITAGLIDAVFCIHEAGFALRCLTLQNIVLDGDNGTHIRVVPTPLLVEVEGGTSVRGRDDVYDHYVKWSASQGTPLPNAFTQERSMMEPISCINLDAYSLGACLFHIAFGHALPPLPGLESADDVEVASMLLTAGLCGDVDEMMRKMSVSASRSTNSEAKAIYETYDSPVKLVLVALHKYSERDITALTSLWEAFRDIAVHGDVSSTGAIFVESAAVAYWEKLLHGVTRKIRRNGAVGARHLSDKILAFAGTATSSKLSIDRVKKMISDEFDMIMTTAECEVFVKSLHRCSESSNGGRHISETGVRPMHEKIMTGLRHFTALFDDIVAYGSFQEFIFIICQYLKAAGSRQSFANTSSVLAKLRTLPFFDEISDLERDIAMRLAKSFLSGYSSTPHDFVKTTLLSPLVSCLTELFQRNIVRSVGDNSKHILEHQLVATHVETISNVLNCIEELLAIKNASLSGAKCDRNTFSHLLASGVDVDWIIAGASCDILKEVVSSKVIHVLVMFTLRFLALDSAHITQPASDGHDGSSVKLAYEGLSMGSRLLIRVSKFFEFFITCIHAMSKRMSKIRRTMEFSQAPSEEETKKTVLIMEETDMLDRCFFTIASAVTMLCTGDETYSPVFGTRSQNLMEAYGDIFAGVTCDETARFSSAVLAARMHWSSQLSKLFEPLLADIVAEDGRGNSSKLLCSTQEISYADKFVTIVAMMGPSR